MKKATLSFLAALCLAACPPWWTPGTFFWESKINFEDQCPGIWVWPAPFSETINGVTVTFSSETYLTVFEIDPLEQDETVFGHRVMAANDGVIRMDFSHPLSNLQIHIGSTDCEDGTPGLYCYTADDELFTGDCQYNPSGCTTFGPSTCESEAGFQWYFAAESTNPVTGEHKVIDWCELRTEGDREIFIGTLGLAVAAPSPPGGGGGGLE